MTDVVPESKTPETVYIAPDVKSLSSLEPSANTYRVKFSGTSIVNMMHIFDHTKQWEALIRTFNFDRGSIQFDCPQNNRSLFKIQFGYPNLLRERYTFADIPGDEGTYTSATGNGLVNVANVLKDLREKFHRYGMPGAIYYFDYGTDVLTKAAEKKSLYEFAYTGVKRTFVASSTSLDTLGSVADVSLKNWSTFSAAFGVQQDTKVITASHTFDINEKKYYQYDTSTRPSNVPSLWGRAFTYSPDYFRMWQFFAKASNWGQINGASSQAKYPGAIALILDVAVTNTSNVGSANGGDLPFCKPLRDVDKIYPGGKLYSSDNNLTFIVDSLDAYLDNQVMNSIQKVLSDLASGQFTIPIDFSTFPPDSESNIAQFGVSFKTTLYVAGGLGGIQSATKNLIFSSANGFKFHQDVDVRRVDWNQSVKTSGTYICDPDDPKSCLQLGEAANGDYICTNLTDAPCSKTDGNPCHINMGYAFGNCLARIPQTNLVSLSIAFGALTDWSSRERSVFSKMINICTTILNSVTTLQQASNVWASIGQTKQTALLGLLSSLNLLVQQIQSNHREAFQVYTPEKRNLYEILKERKVCAVVNDGVKINSITKAYDTFWTELKDIANNVRANIGVVNSLGYQGSTESSTINGEIVSTENDVANFLSAGNDTSGGLINNGTGTSNLPGQTDPSFLNQATNVQNAKKMPSWSTPIIVVIAVIVLLIVAAVLYLKFVQNKK